MTTHAQQQHSRRPKEGEAPPPRPSDEELAEMGAVARRVVDQVSNIVVGAVTTEQLNSLKSDAGILGGMLPAPPIGAGGGEGEGGPEPGTEVPTATGMEPDTGPDGTMFMVAGANLQDRGGSSAVTIGAEAATIQTWSPTGVVASAVQGASPADEPQAVVVHCQDGQEAAAGMFTFTAAGRDRKPAGRR